MKSSTFSILASVILALSSLQASAADLSVEVPKPGAKTYAVSLLAFQSSQRPLTPTESRPPRQWRALDLIEACTTGFSINLKSDQRVQWAMNAGTIPVGSLTGHQRQVSPVKDEERLLLNFSLAARF